MTTAAPRSFRVVRPTLEFDAMLAFYRDVLGWPVVGGWDDGPDDRGVFFSPGVGEVTVEFLTAGDTEGVGNTALAVEVADADTEQERLEAAGVRIAFGLEDAPWGHRRFGIDDPDGMRIWIYHELVLTDRANAGSAQSRALPQIQMSGHGGHEPASGWCRPLQPG